MNEITSQSVCERALTIPNSDGYGLHIYLSYDDKSYLNCFILSIKMLHIFWKTFLTTHCILHGKESAI